MDQIKTGALIRAQRLRQGMTQLQLAEQIGVSDKTVSKWERGCGAPDIELLPALSTALGVDTTALLSGALAENERSNGNLRKTRFFVCPACGNLILATDEADICCCGQRLKPLKAQKPDAEHTLTIEKNDGEWYITAAHPMQREHAIAFVALLNGDTLTIKRLYPEWNLEARLPYLAHGTFLWYCTRDGLFYQHI